MRSLNNFKPSMPVVLSIAGSDCCAGAGIQADMRTCAALGVYCATVITAVTAQNPYGLYSVLPVGRQMLRNQLEAVLEAVRPDAVKIGMLGSSEAVEIVAEVIRNHQLTNIVADPVLSATCGGSLAGAEKEETAWTIKNFKTLLMPHATLITPNIPELFRLCGESESTKEGEWDISGEKIVNKAEELMRHTGCHAILVKGGHAQESQSAICSDILIQSENGLRRITEFSGPRIDSPNTHGTGCVLSSAIACGLAKGADLESAVAGAKNTLESGIRGGLAHPVFPENGPLLFG